MKQFYSAFLALLLSFAAIGNLQAQVDTEFWFAAPEVSVSNANFDKPIILRLISQNQASTVTVTQPANPGFNPITVNVPANGTANVDLTAFINNIEIQPPNTVLNYGLHITATAPITAYYEVVSQQCLCNPEIFALKGSNALGTSFLTPFQTFLDNGNAYNPLPYASFDIVATEDNTTITIVPSQNIVGHPAGTSFTINLNRGQVWSGTATSQAAAQHPMGSLINSDKPIAVTIKDDLLSGAPYGGCADLMGDQIVPTSVIGDEYIVMKGALNGNDKAFVLATQNGTTVTVAGANAGTINAGQSMTVDISAASTYIQTSAPAYILHLSGFGCEVGGAVLPPIVCTGSDQLGFTRSTNEQFALNLMTRSGNEGNFVVNGNAGLINAGAFAPVPNTNGDWVAAQIYFNTTDIPVGQGSIISNTSGKFHMGVIHGSGGGGTRYGYFSKFNTVLPPVVASSLDVCDGDDLQLTADSDPGATFSWTGPNGFTSTDQNPLIPSATAVNSGTYAVVAEVDGCVSDTAFSEVEIVNCPGDLISGTINEYSEVTAVDYCENLVTVGNVSPFAVGDRTLIIQMKGATIDLSNTAAYGDITNLGDAGNYEIGTIAQINGSNIVFENELLNTYDVNGLVQLVTVPQYTDVSITGTLTCQPWNGTIGGVLIFEATGNVSLAADIDVSGMGFRGGQKSIQVLDGCSSMDYFYDFAVGLAGQKGEGITPNVANADAGRGKLANGGGGGNHVNAGGAGGGNGGLGGNGGNQWNGCPIIDIGGRGGLAMNYSNAANRVFLGGGGGGAHQNDGNNQGTNGENGGGIVIIRAGGNIEGNGNSIIADGNDVSIVGGSEGAGGGGAGGVVMVDAPTFNGNLNVSSKGGQGGDLSVTGHGTGGGGGGGVAWFSAGPPGNVNTDVAGGREGHLSDGTDYNALPGQDGVVLGSLTINESQTPFALLDTPLVSTNAPICDGEDLELYTDAVPNATYNWSGPNGFTSNDQNPVIASATPNETGTYSLYITVDGCDSPLGDTLATVNPLPTPSISGLQAEYCLLDDTVAVNLNPSGGTLSGNGVSGTSFVPELAGTGTHELIYAYTDTNGCSDSDTTNVIVSPMPQPQIQNLPAGHCIDADTIALDATPIGGTFSGNGVSGTTFDPVLAGVGTHDLYYQFTDTNNCTVTDTGTIEVYPEAQATITPGPELTICPGDVITLNANSSASYNWSTTENTASIDINSGGLYWVDILDTNGCAASDTVDVYESPIPMNIQLSSEDATCFGFDDGQASVAINGGTAPFSILWNDASAQITDTATNLEAGIYQVTVTDSIGCTKTDSIAVGEPNELTVQVAHPDIICLSDTADLISTVNGGTQPYSYQWSTSDTAANIQVSPSQTTTYGLTITDSNNCIATFPDFDIVVRPELEIDIADVNPVCRGTSVQLNATVDGGDGNYLIVWDNGLAPNVQNHTVSPATTTTYSVTVSDGCGTPPATDSVEVVIYQIPEPAFTLEPNDGCIPLEVTFTDQSSVTDASVVDWAWQTSGGHTSNDTNPVFIFTQDGTFDVTLTVTSNQGCDSTITESGAVIARPLPVADFLVTPEYLTIENATAYFNNTSTGAQNYLWDFGNGDSSTVVNPEVLYSDTGTYLITLIAENEFGCLDTTFGEIQMIPELIIYAPDAFTPDGNSLNETFRVYGMDFQEFHLRIFNRWGEQVFYSSNPETGWDGKTPNGNLAKQDVYIYRVLVKGSTGAEQSLMGKVLLLRGN